MNSDQLMRLVVAGGIVFAAYKWGNAELRTGALAIAAVIVAKQIPFVQDYV